MSTVAVFILFSKLLVNCIRLSLSPGLVRLRFLHTLPPRCGLWVGHEPYRDTRMPMPRRRLSSQEMCSPPLTGQTRLSSPLPRRTSICRGRLEDLFGSKLSVLICSFTEGKGYFEGHPTNEVPPTVLFGCIPGIDSHDGVCQWSASVER